MPSWAFIEMFSAPYNIAKHEIICEYRPEPSRIVSGSESVIDTNTNPLSPPANLHWDIEQEFVTSGAGAARSRNS